MQSFNRTQTLFHFFSSFLQSSLTKRSRAARRPSPPRTIPLYQSRIAASLTRLKGSTPPPIHTYVPSLFLSFPSSYDLSRLTSVCCRRHCHDFLFFDLQPEDLPLCQTSSLLATRGLSYIFKMVRCNPTLSNRLPVNHNTSTPLPRMAQHQIQLVGGHLGTMG